MTNQPTTDVQTIREYRLETYSWYLREIGEQALIAHGVPPWQADTGRLELLRAQALEISELREAIWRSC
ncbi:hypothetical protein LCGC14_1022090 [marine sediment metagenome]|uniref:Uncharacterized protein n=1 Tax=marine sediment metagenome TaxID=412755 RepID=A0A0F9NIP1_9ZZZZ